MNKISTFDNDYGHRYEILAYRKLTKSERSKVISDFKKRPNKKTIKPLKDIIVIDTEIR